VPVERASCTRALRASVLRMASTSLPDLQASIITKTFWALHCLIDSLTKALEMPPFRSSCSISGAVTSWGMKYHSSPTVSPCPAR